LTKSPLIYSVAYFNLGALGALFGEAKPTEAPVTTGLVLYCVKTNMSEKEALLRQRIAFFVTVAVIWGIFFVA